MGTEKYISEVKIIPASQEAVYNLISNFENLGQLFDPSRIDEMKKLYPDAPDIQLENFQSSVDECSFSINPIGQVGVHIIERDPLKSVKLAGSKSIPFQFTCWIQLVAIDEMNCKVKITLHAELSMMFKMLVNKHLKEGVDRIADALTRIQYT